MTGRLEWRVGAEQVWAPTAEEMAALDRRAVETGRTAERTLIEAAGRELAHRLAAAWPEGPVCGLVGSGHNGADALVALRTLAAWGRDVRAVLGGSGPPDPDVRAGWPIELEPAPRFREDPPRSGVLLDGLLGTGASGAPRDAMAGLIERANALGLPIIAADLPSGANATTGDVPGACVRADLTVCFGWPKLGLLRSPARSRCGRIQVVEIGFPPVEPDAAPAARVLTPRWVRSMLRSRAPDGHKGTSGYLLLAAGAPGMAGAAVLAARGAYRAGAGIVRQLGAPENREIIQRAVPGAIFAPWDVDPVDGLAWSHAIAVGPGLGREAARRALVERLLDGREDRPVVVDADGLNLFSDDPGALASRLGPGDVVTPHPGEMERLGADASRDESPVATARLAAERFGCTVVLKGTPTVVASPDGPARVATTGGPAFSVGGTGDVLTGAIGALLATGYPAVDAASVALQLTGIAAELTGFGDVGMVAEDLPEAIPEARGVLESLGSAPPGALLLDLPTPVGREPAA